MEPTELVRLLELPNKHFEGHLVLQADSMAWTLSFVQGRLIYAADGLHAVRRWNRTLQQYFPNCSLDIKVTQLSSHEFWQIYLLDQGVNQKQLSLVRSKLMLRRVFQECLFELGQCQAIKHDWQPSELSASRFCRSIALSQWELQMAFNKAKDMLQGWDDAKLSGISPTLSPTLKKPVVPPELVIPHQYITGNYTLWDLAAKLDRSVAEIAKNLFPFVEEEILGFQTIADLPLSTVQLSTKRLPAFRESAAAVEVVSSPKSALLPVVPSATKTVSPPTISKVASQRVSPPTIPTATVKAKISTSPTVSVAPSKSVESAAAISPPPKSEAVLSSNDTTQPLIACIDDSPVLAHSLKKILAAGGYRTLIIHEPMQGFSQLIEHMPCLILLDVMLPHTDGYNVCRFLRETPVFSKTPILILTGRSRPVDRARASMAGATEFLVKPPEPKALLQMIRKHLNASEKMSS